MAGRPPKPAALLRLEGKSHKSGAELEQRERAEAALLTGKRMREWPSTRNSDAAHKLFLRLRSLLKGIGKDDALSESNINRYCIIQAETEDMEKDRCEIVSQQGRLREWMETGEIDEKEYGKRMGDLIGQKIALEKGLAKKRDQLLAIEKENAMTIAAALRSIPKKPEGDEDNDPMSRMLAKRSERQAGRTG